MELAVILMNSFDIHVLVTCTFAERPLCAVSPWPDAFLGPQLSHPIWLCSLHSSSGPWFWALWKAKVLQKTFCYICYLGPCRFTPTPNLVMPLELHAPLVPLSTHPAGLTTHLVLPKHGRILEHLKEYQGSSQLRECPSHLIFRTRKPNWVPAPLLTCVFSGFSSIQIYHSEV